MEEMKIVDVIPMVRGIPTDTLSYFTLTDIPLGSVISVPIRKKNIHALVVGKREASEAKMDLKQADFSLRKLTKVKPFFIFSTEFIRASEKTAKYFAGSTGSVFDSLVPEAILENAEKLHYTPTTAKQNILHEKFVVQANDEDRYAHYKSLIREEFAKNRSVIFCLPTVQDIKKALDTLPKGIEQYTYVLHGALPKKEIVETWKELLEEKHSVLIIATGAFLSIPRTDVGTIIIDKESSRSYKGQVRPFIDIRTFAGYLAESIGARLVYGDMMLRVETIWRHDDGELHEMSPLKFRSLTTSEQKIIDMRTGNTVETKESEDDSDFSSTEKSEPLTGATEQEKNNSKAFAVFSDEALELIKRTQEQSEHLFLFSARRGLAPSTVCGHCGTIVRCHHCNAPSVLHTTSDRENFFLCHRCGERRSALEKCKTCDSWKLVTLGIGTEKIEEELRTRFPTLKIFKIDADTAPTHKRAYQTAEKFYASPGSVLIGTEMSLLYLTEKIENTAVISIDSFFALPDFRINERILGILLKIRSITSKIGIIQTRDSKEKI
ncbi:MAG: hypothetical protein WCW14_00270, partial [Candidatus Paceibacterota bacterium]